VIEPGIESYELSQWVRKALVLWSIPDTPAKPIRFGRELVHHWYTIPQTDFDYVPSASRWRGSGAVPKFRWEPHLPTPLPLQRSQAMPTNINKADLHPRLAFAREIAREAGEITLRYFQQPDLNVERKSDSSPVTIADKSAEQHLRARIAAAFPHDAILGEEFDDVAGTSGYRWILDPIDGTKSFISGVPLYSTLIGVEHGGRSLIGLIRVPALDESVFAMIGGGAWHQKGNAEPTPARVSQRPLNAGLFITSQVDSFAKRGAEKAYRALEQVAYIARSWGDGYGYLLVATGRAELMVDPIMNIWDAAAIQPVLEEAGGTFTDWSGRPTIHSGEGIATNGVDLESVLTITRPFANAARSDV